MIILVKLCFVAAALGGAYYLGDKHVLAIVAVVMAPLAAILFTRDMMNFFSGTTYAMRKHAYDSDARVFKYGYTQMRVIMYRNRAWFAAAPVCAALGYADVQKSIRHYATTEYCVRGTKKDPFLSESGVRRMAAISRHSEAQSFLRWFDNEVLTTLENTRRRMRRTDEPLDIDLSDSPPADRS